MNAKYNKYKVGTYITSSSWGLRSGKTVILHVANTMLRPPPNKGAERRRTSERTPRLDSDCDADAQQSQHKRNDCEEYSNKIIVSHFTLPHRPLSCWKPTNRLNADVQIYNYQVQHVNITLLPM